MNLYEFSVWETANERGYTTTEYVYAENEAQARELARKYIVEDYFSDPTVEVNQDTWETKSGEYGCKLGYLREIDKIEVAPINGETILLTISGGNKPCI